MAAQGQPQDPEPQGAQVKVTIATPDGRAMTEGELRHVIDQALVKSPDMQNDRKARIIAEIKRQAAIDPLNINVKDGDFELALNGTEIDAKMPTGAHLISIDTDPKKYRFITRDERVDLAEASKFVTLKAGDLDKLVGHPVTLGADGKPNNLTEADAEVLGATFAVYQSIQDNPLLSKESKGRIIERLKHNLAAGKLVDEACADAISYDQGYRSIDEQMKGLPPRARRQKLKEMKRDQHRRRLKLERDIKANQAQGDWLKRIKSAYEELNAWVVKPLVLQKPPQAMFHHMRQAVLDGESLIVASLGADKSVTPKDFDANFELASVFVVEHDWASAFADGQDYEGGEFKLPDDVCAFEFRISGHHVIAVCFELDGRMYLQPIPLTSHGWLIPGSVYYTANGEWAIERGPTLTADHDQCADLVKLLGRQIRAVSIALDAEVATSEIVRAPHKLNHARERRGKLPMNSYHVVSLARRSRAPRLERDQDAPPGTPRRCHFRRGHWRHYDDHKTWIHWMLVGDPDLGFVEKHYKL